MSHLSSSKECIKNGGKVLKEKRTGKEETKKTKTSPRPSFDQHYNLITCIPKRAFIWDFGLTRLICSVVQPIQRDVWKGEKMRKFLLWLPESWNRCKWCGTEHHQLSAVWTHKVQTARARREHAPRTPLLGSDFWNWRAANEGGNTVYGEYRGRRAWAKPQCDFDSSTVNYILLHVCLDKLA